MYDETIQSNSEGEQSIYEKFMERLKTKLFIEKLWDALDEMEDDNLNDNQEE